MPIFCKTGDKPKVTYKINNQSRIFYSPVSPIEVDVFPTGKCWKVTSFNATSDRGNGFRLVPNGLTVVTYMRAATLAKVDRTVPDGSYYTGSIASYLIVNGKLRDGLAVDWQWVEESNITLCPSGVDGECQIQVKSAGKVIFSDVGKCPINFDVACGGRCPDGFIECKTNKYPGYCCLPCKETASKIRSLGAKLHG